MSALKTFISIAFAVISCGAIIGCGSGEDTATPQVSSPPPNGPVPGMSESGASGANQGGGAGASTLKGPSND